MAVSVKKGTFAAATGTGNQAVTGVGFQGKAVLLWGVQATATGFQAGGGWFFGAATGTANRWAKAGFSANAAAGGDCWRENDTAACIHTIADATGTADGVADFVSFDSDGFTINWSNAPASAWIVHYLVIGGTDVSALALPFDQPAAVGAQAITGVGFKPKALIACHVFAGSSGVHNSMGLGFATSTSVNESVSMFHRDRDAVATTDHASVQLTDRCITGVSSTAATILANANVASWGADGVTMNWVATPGIAAEGIGYLFLGGTAKYMAGADEQRTSTGTKLTRVGMAPAGVIVGSFTGVASTGVDTGTTDWCVGASDGTDDGHIWHSAQDGQATSNVDVRTDTTSLMGMATQPSTVNADGAVSAMAYPGFTIDWTTADASPRQFIYLAIGTDQASSQPMGDNPLLSQWVIRTNQFVNRQPSDVGPAVWTNWYFETSGLSTVGKSLVLVWNVQAPVAKTGQLVWNISTPVAKTGQLVWNISTPVAKTGQLVWNISTPVAKTGQLVWNTQAAVANTGQLVWNISTPVSKTQVLIWNVSTPVAKTGQLVWNVSTPVAKTGQLVWDLRAAIPKTQILIWNVSTPVAKTGQLVWNLRNTVRPGFAAWYDYVMSYAPRVYMRMNDTSGPAQDVSGNANHFSATAGGIGYSRTGLIAGDSDTAIELFSGNSMTKTDLTNPPTDFLTVAISVKAAGTAASWSDIVSYGWTIPGGWNLYESASSLIFGVTDSTSSQRNASTSLIPRDGNPHRLVGTYDGSNVRLYVDGVLAATQAIVNAPGSLVATGSFRSDAAFNSLIVDELAILGVAWSAEEVARDYRYSIEGVSPQQKILWNIRAAIPKTGQLVWNIQSAIAKTGQLVWNIQAAVAKTGQLVWNISSIVAKTGQLVWDIRAAIAKTGQLVWNVSTPVAKTGQLVWDVSGAVTAVGKEQILLWNILTPVAKTGQIVWNISAIVAKTGQLVWNVSTPVAATRVLVWNISTPVAKTGQLVWDIRALVTNSRALVWNVSSLVARERSLLWDVRASVSTTRVLIWNISTPVSVSDSLLWNISTSVGVERDLLWDLRAAVGNTRILIWNAEGPVAVPRDLLWNIQTAVGKSSILIWNVSTPVAKTGQLVWNLRANVTKSSILIWNVLADVALSNVLLWDLLSVVNNSGLRTIRNWEDGFIYFISGNNTTRVNSQDFARNGTSSLKVTSPGGMVDSYAQWTGTNGFPVLQPNSGIEWSIWVMSPTATFVDLDGCYIQENGGSSRKIAKAGSTRLALSPGVWTQLSGAATIPSDWHTSSRIVVRPPSVGSGTPQPYDTTPIYYDDCTIQQIGSGRLLWNVQSLAAKSGQLVWDLRAAVSRSRSLLWDVLGPVGTQRDLLWSSRATVGATRVLLWDLRSAVWVTRTLPWNVSTSVSQSRSLLWDLEGSIARAESLLWNVEAPVSKDGALLWNVLVAVDLERNLLWDVTSPVAVSRVLLWDLASEVFGGGLLVIRPRVGSILPTTGATGISGSGVASGIRGSADQTGIIRPSPRLVQPPD